MFAHETVLLTLVVVLATPAAEGVEGVRWVTQALAEAMFDFSPSSETNPQCNLDSSSYRQALANSTLWAVQMFDASSLTVGGLLYGDMYHLGHYEQCLAVHVPESHLRGQYCLATLRYGPQPQLYPQFYNSSPNVIFQQPPLSASVWEKVKVTKDPVITRRDLFHWAVCMPASCSPQDLQLSLNTTLDKVLSKLGLTGEVFVDPEYCYQSRGYASQGFVTVTCTMAVLVLIAVTATIFDYVKTYYVEDKPDPLPLGLSEQLLYSFSVRRNMELLLEKGSNHKTDVINGMKWFCMLFIITGHRLIYSLGLAHYNNENWELKFEVSFWNNAMLNITHFVDMYFLASGFLTTLKLYKTLQANKQVNFFLDIFRRWLRLVPPYILVIVVYGWCLPTLGDGPLWDKRVGLEARRCRDNWWLNLLFINNYVHANNQCLILSWYLACDMQFFVVGIFASYVLWRWRRVGYALFSALFVATFAVPFIITYNEHYSGVIKPYPPSLMNDLFSNNHFTNFYVKSHNRVTPYVIGAFTAFLCVKLSEANYKFSKGVILAGFVVLSCGGYAYQWYCYFFYIKDRPYNALENAFYAAFHRISFPLGMAWIALTYYTTGYGLFKMLFAQPTFTPLCRLLYCTMLLHPLVQLAEAASMRNSPSLDVPKLIWMVAGDVSLSTFLAGILYLLVEAPSRTLVQLLLSRMRSVKRLQIIRYVGLVSTGLVEKVSDFTQIPQQSNKSPSPSCEVLPHHQDLNNRYLCFRCTIELF